MVKLKEGQKLDALIMPFAKIIEADVLLRMARVLHEESQKMFEDAKKEFEEVTCEE